MNGKEDTENIEPSVNTPRSARRANVIKTIINQLPLNVNQLNSIKHEITPGAQLQNNIHFIKEQLKSRGINEVTFNDFQKKDSSTSYEKFQDGYYMSRIDKEVNVDNEQVCKVIAYETNDYAQYVDMSKIEKDSLEYDSLVPKINVDSDKGSNYLHVSSIPRDIDLSNYEQGTADTSIAKPNRHSSATSACNCNKCRLFRDKLNQNVQNHKHSFHYHHSASYPQSSKHINPQIRHAQNYQINYVNCVRDNQQKNKSLDAVEFYERALEQRNKRCKYFHHQNRANPHGIYREYLPRGMNPFDSDCTIGDKTEQHDTITIENEETGSRNWFVKRFRTLKRRKKSDLDNQSWKVKFVGFFRSVFSCASTVVFP